nr:dnaJ homolog subfamily C member 7-like [Procambarus clarkii]
MAEPQQMDLENDLSYNSDDDVVIIEESPTVNDVGIKACMAGKRKVVCSGEGPPPRRQRLAERKKNEGNDLYKNKDYREALKLYTQAIDLCPDCAAYFSNRSACYMMLGKYYEALNDAREAVRLDTSFVKGYLRVAKCNIALGDATAALSVLRQANELEPNNKALREETSKAQSLVRCQEEVVKATAKADYRTAIFHLDRALDLAVGCRNLKITKAEYLVFLQRYADAQEMVNEILQYESGNADAIYVRGMCLYYQDNPEAAFNHFQHVLRLAPDHQKARDVYKKAKLLKQKKEEGNDAFKKGNFLEAFNLYTEALAIDPLNKHTNAKLYFNRATVGSKINKLEQATEDCTAAINLDEGYVKAYLRRAKCYQLLEKHEEAVRDYEKVTRLDRNQGKYINNLAGITLYCCSLHFLVYGAGVLCTWNVPEHFSGVFGNMSSEDCHLTTTSELMALVHHPGERKMALVHHPGERKMALVHHPGERKMALVHHPDRHANASDKDKHEHEIKFKEIGEAYSVLTDAKKRAMYDRGQDINDPEGGFGHDDIDPNQIFQAFFGGGHGGYSFGGHNAGFQQAGFPGNGFGGGGFPGGFHFQFG